MPLTPATAHIINHTHWDREWFLTSVYTSHWIPGLIDKLEQLVAENPDFQFLLDGQTLVIEDLLATVPAYRPRVEALIRNGNLIVGPYYCQPDWQLTGGELLLRNLRCGQQDLAHYGGSSPTGWLVDTFGHISQAPQIHRLFGIDAVYVWRGVPRLAPYFRWEAPNGQHLFAIDLFGGYRNLYGITHAPDLAVQRLEAEVAKLRPYYPTGDIPLFDGYDLEDNPEDPVRFYEQTGADLPEELTIVSATPASFVETVRPRLDTLPTIRGELNSGKYGATFPGTLSARTYLKVMARDCEHLLYAVGEPLAVLARLRGRPYPAAQVEAWTRALLQNAVHDCICGVSIDQVHEKMEHTYRQVFDGVQADVRDSLAAIMCDFAPGTYAVSTNPFAYDGWQPVGDACYHVSTEGVGVWRIHETLPVDSPHEPAGPFEWHNDHYTARLRPDGTLQVGTAILGALVVASEQGDTYSDEPGEPLGVCTPVEAPVIEQRSAAHCVLRLTFGGTWDGISIQADVRLTFDQSPLIRWQVDLDSRGTDFQVSMVFDTAQRGPIHAAMPFDVVQRPAADTDLLPRQLERALSDILLGQRELDAVRTFPFHDFVAIRGDTATVAILAHGLHAYQADAAGRIMLPLRRSVEWLTKADLACRVGDAGPFFYVPDARCERRVTHELAVLVGAPDMDDLDLQRANAGFQNPPLIVETHSPGTRTEWAFWREALPLTSLHLRGETLLARVHNPTDRDRPLSQDYPHTTPAGEPLGTNNAIPAKTVATLHLDSALPPARVEEHPAIHLVTELPWRVGPNHGLPDPPIVEQLKERCDRLESELAATTEQLNGVRGNERHLLQHRCYVLERELYEYRLSARLNELKLAAQGRITEDYLYTRDEAVTTIGLRLNQLRIKRRIYDYVVQMLQTGS